MAFEVYWDDPQKSIIRADGQGKWTWDDFHAAIDLISDMVASVHHKVHLVVIPGSHMPAGSGMPHFRRAGTIMPDNLGLTLMVTDSTFIRLIANTLTKLLNARTHNKSKAMVMVATLDEARALIAKEQARRA